MLLNCILLFLSVDRGFLLVFQRHVDCSAPVALSYTEGRIRKPLNESSSLIIETLNKVTLNLHEKELHGKKILT